MIEILLFSEQKFVMFAVLHEIQYSLFQMQIFLRKLKIVISIN